MKINSRDKGAKGEREICKILNERLGTTLSRNLKQYQVGGYDLEDSIQGLFNEFAPEVKRVEKLNVEKWWEQAKKQAKEQGKIPLLFYRQNRKSWTVVVPSGIIVKFFHSKTMEPISISLEAFCSFFEAMKESQRMVETKDEQSFDI